MDEERILKVAQIYLCHLFLVGNDGIIYRDMHSFFAHLRRIAFADRS